MKVNDHKYPLVPYQSFAINLKTDGNLCVPRGINKINTTILLQVNYKPKSKGRYGHVMISTDNTSTRQFFDSKDGGIRYINLSNTELSGDIKIHPVDCTIDTDVILLTFNNPDISDGPTLILSPHPDDAELAAFGFYSDFASQTWIVTISAGELLRKIDKQYLKGLDSDLSYATYRKGFIRAWNSVTTPLLAQVPREHLYCLGYFNEMVGEILNEPHTPTKNPYNPKIGIKDFRHWNPTLLPGDINGLHSGDNLISDLVALIEKIRPSTILVTHPEVDPHKDHVATAKALAMAMQKSLHQPKRILMYANHLRGASNFPYGPEHTRATLFPWNKEESKLGKWQCYSHPLSLERQKEKIVAFDTMHDLHGKERWEKRLKQWWGKTVLKNGYHYYGNHGYFQTHIKADEVFCWVTGDAFLRGMTEQS